MALKGSDSVKRLLENTADDEDIFILCARDILAPAVVRKWASEAHICGGVPAEKIQEAHACADRMQARKGRKVPD